MKRGTKCVVQTINLSNPKTCIRPKVQKLVSANADSSSDSNRASDYWTPRPTAVKVCSWKEVQRKCLPKVKIIKVFRDLIDSQSIWDNTRTIISSNCLWIKFEDKKKVLALMWLEHCSTSNKYHNREGNAMLKSLARYWIHHTFHANREASNSRLNHVACRCVERSLGPHAILTRHVTRWWCSSTCTELVSRYVVAFTWN